MAEDWRSDLEVWLAPFLQALRHKTRMRVRPAYIAGLIGPVTARACSQWRLVVVSLAMTNCIISSPTGCGIVRHSRPYS